jgi:hypothetical protein
VTSVADKEAHAINVSVIAPTAYLRDFAAQDPATVHHVAAQRVLSDPEYRTFFLEEAELGAGIIVDNGVFDLGEALSAADLVRAARAVRAREIILPDVMHDGPATIRASDLAARQILEITDQFRLCAVVHAADDREWNLAYDHFAASDYTAAIAFPASRSKEPSRELPKNRVAATAYLEDNGRVVPGLIYRLLGFGRTGHLELISQRAHTWISSIDGAAPVLLGMMGVRMLPRGPYDKPPTPRVETITHIDPERFTLIRDNIRAVRAAAGCPIKIRPAR